MARMPRNTARLGKDTVHGLLSNEGAVNVQAIELLEHEIEAGDTWDSIATAHRTTRQGLDFGNHLRQSWRGDWTRTEAELKRQPEQLEVEPAVGKKIAVAMRVAVRPDHTLTEIVLALGALAGALDRILEINELDRPEELAALTELQFAAVLAQHPDRSDVQAA